MERFRPNSISHDFYFFFNLGQKIQPNPETSVDMIPLGFEDTSLYVSKLAVCQSTFHDAVSV